MRTDTTSNESPTGSANNTAGHTDNQIVLDAADAGKAAVNRLASLHAVLFRGGA